MADAPEQYLEQYALLCKFKEDGDQKKLLEAREEFSLSFPLLSSIWLDWIGSVIFCFDKIFDLLIFRDEIAKDKNNYTVIEKLFERALNDFQSVEVCLRYISWVIDVGFEFAAEVNFLVF